MKKSRNQRLTESIKPKKIQALKSRKWVFALASTCFILATSISTQAQTLVQQAGDNPIALSPNSGSDNLIMLPAGAAEYYGDMSVASSPRPKYGYVTGFENAEDYFRWTVSVTSATTFNVSFQMNSGAANQSYTLQVDSGSKSSFTIEENDWGHVNAGSIALSAGTHSITLRRKSISGTSEVKSMELLRSQDQSAYEARVASYHAAPTDDFSAAPYGVMFQYGAWGYPESGDQKSLDDQAADFNVDAFVSNIKRTGARYVIWSATWWTFEIDAPISAVDDVVGHGRRTSARDLIGDVARALAAEGIDFYLYYHTGQDSHLGYGSTDWWAAQNWPSSFSSNGLGDRDQFFENWMAVIGEMGERYGSLLKGWFFDDARMYYPAHFEALAQAARTGNADRLISYNNANATNITEFQDVSFGETCRRDDAEVGGDGIYVRGAEKGLAGHCMVKFNNGWGVNSSDYSISDSYSVSSAYSLVETNSSRNVPTSFDLLMYEDGSMSESSLSILEELSGLFGCGDNCSRINNTDTDIAYTGSWALSSGRKNGDLGGDVQYTTTNGDSFSYTFDGIGVRVYMPTYGSYGDFEVFIDGDSMGSYSAYDGSGYTAMVNTFAIDGLSDAKHTLKLVKTSGSYMQLDYLEVDTSPEPIVVPTTQPTPSPEQTCGDDCRLIDSADDQVSYSGSWAVSSNRNTDDLGGDLNYTTNNGDSASFTFTGSGVSLYMPTYASYGDFEVIVDGQSMGIYSAYSDSGYTAQVKTYSVADLNYGEHTIEIVKVSGGYMQLDYLEVDTSVAANQAPTATFNLPANQAVFSVGDTVVVDVAASDDSAVSNVKLYLNGSFVRQESVAPYQWSNSATNDSALKNMVAGDYQLTAVVEDDQGVTSQASMTFSVEEVSSQCDLPWTAADISMTQETVNTSLGIIDISCVSTASIYMDIEGTGPMENSDYLNISYRVDGGSAISLSANTNAFSQKNIALENISGATLEILIDGYTSYGDETYSISNINVIDGGDSGGPYTGETLTLDSHSWTLSSSTYSSDVYNAIDGDASTRWSSHAVQSDGQQFEIALNATQTFNRIILDSEQSPNDYPRQYEVFVSSDGSNWSSVVSGTSSSATTVIDFDQQTAAFVRIEQQGSNSRYWWSIHELQLLLGEFDDGNTNPVDGYQCEDPYGLADCYQAVYDQGGGTVALQNQTYYLSDTIILRSNVNVIGQGMDKSIITWEKSIQDTVNKAFFEGQSDIPIKNVIWSGFKLACTMDRSYADPRNSHHGITIGGAGVPRDDDPDSAFSHGNITASNLEISNCADGWAMSGANGVTIDNIHLHHNSVDGSQLYHNLYFNRCQNVEITNSSFTDSYTGHGMRLAKLKNFVIDNVEVTNNGDHGLHMNDDENLLFNGVIEGNCWNPDAGNCHAYQCYGDCVDVEINVQ